MEIIRSIILGIRFIGLKGVLRTLIATFHRWLHEYNYRTESVSVVTTLGKLLSIETSSNGLSATYEHAHLEIFVLASDLIRVTWTPGRLPTPYAIYQEDWESVAIEINNEIDHTIISTEKLIVKFCQDGQIEFFTNASQPLTTFIPPVRVGTGWHQLSISQESEHIYGMGEQASPLNLRGGSHRLWNRDPGGSYGPGSDPLYLTIPLFLGLHDRGSYLAFFENSYDGTITFHDMSNPLPIENSFGQPVSFENRQNMNHIHFVDGALRYYLIPGPVPRMIERYTQLTGRHNLPPLWSLGLHQSRWGYKNEHDIRAVASGYKKHNLPISAIHLDIDYMDAYRVFTVNVDRFPDLKGLTADLESMGIQLVTIIDPGVKIDPDYHVYQSGSDSDVFCKLMNNKSFRGLVWPGWCVFPDFTHPDVRDWWQNLYSPLFEAGVNGIWHDMNEPTSFVSWGDSTFPISVQHDMDGQPTDHCGAHNLYALLMNRAGFNAFQNHVPNKRPWIFSRSGWAGMQRYAWSWTGDTESSWPALRMTVPMMINLGLSGIGYTGPDIGGFSGAPDDELLIRWLQLATFLPFYRIHSAVATPRREPWTFSEDVLEILRKFINLRYQLLPYIYTLAWQCSQSGHPLIRPIFWINERENRYWQIDDCFLLGDDLLIAPVLDQQSATREILLPEGEWYDFWSDAIHQGPVEIEISCDLERIPVFVRAGSILPLNENDQLVYHVYPHTDGESHSACYKDIGDGYGPSLIESFNLQRSANQLLITRQTQGEFEPPSRDHRLQVHGFLIDAIKLDGKPCDHDGIRITFSSFDQALIQLSAPSKGN